jgi:murein L,D-transpeptidase YafK
MKTKRLISIILVISLMTLTAYYFYPENPLPLNTKIDSLVVYKSKRVLQAYSNGQVIKIYKISLGKHPIGDKEFEGDKRTPEGLYFINDKNSNSGYYKNLGISYPNKNDIKQSKELGKSTGGDVKIHGLRNGLGLLGKLQRWIDWTAGCIALTDQEVEELYNAVAIGTPIDIKP